MKRTLLIALCVVFGVILVSSIATAQTYLPGKGIKGTPHDLSTKGGAPTKGDPTEQGAEGLDRICIYCHAPHNTVKLNDAAGVDYIPLWNHEITVQDYALYSNGPAEPDDPNHASKAEELLAGQTRPGGVSRLCLSCHDATVATNSYGYYGSLSSGAKSEFLKAPFIIGGDADLTNHHPVGFNYHTVEGTDDEIAVASTNLIGSPLTISSLLWENNMECTTCHDVHNTKNLGEKFLWVSDQQSTLCLSCHLKGDVKK